MEIELEYEVFEPSAQYGNESKLINAELTYKVLGICFEVHKELGSGFLEAVYKEAIEYELNLAGIKYEREKNHRIKYKDTFLKKEYFSDFFIEDALILEVKAQTGAIEGFYRQTINYLRASKNKVGLIVNFNESSLKYKRLVY